jgi:heme/copper-type cytochrome/quinol oxidase subunit 2
MSIIDILVTIIIVTILVTIVLAVVTYIAYKLRLARRPTSADEPEEPRYFDLHAPPAEAGPSRAGASGA